MSEITFDKHEDRFYTQDGDDVIWFDTMSEARSFVWARKDARNKELEAENERLRAALDQQCDNMAFILNHATLPDQWVSKFDHELSNARHALAT